MARIELLAHKEVGVHGMEVALKPNVPFIITPTLVTEIRVFQDLLANKYFNEPWDSLFYIVWHMECSSLTHWKGLDYNYICESILNHNYDHVEKYINDIFDLLFLTHVGLGLPIMNCAVIDRETTGLSREFFLLNNVCFIHDQSVDDITPIQMNDKQSLVFPLEIYEHNRYFLFKEMNFEKMRKIIASVELPVLTEEIIQRKQMFFEEMKITTMETIYKYANNRMGALTRLADMQKRQVQRHTDCPSQDYAISGV